MARIGRINRLTIKRVGDSGAHLDGGESGDILLPIREVPPHCRAGDEIEVFVYPDREGGLRATTIKPGAMAGQFAILRVVATSAAGAWLHWGMKDDLLVPKSEQLVRMAAGRSYVVFVSLDEESGRIFASSKLDKFLSRQPPPYEEGEEVDLIVYEQTELGYKAVINQAHGGMVYKNEVFKPLQIGHELQGYIKKIRDDHKIDLSLQQSGYQAVDDVSRTILDAIRAHGGRIAVTDKSPPEEIYALFGISKKIFKKGIGALYKKRLISIDLQGIRLAG